jgi:hypothetical protein
MFGLAARFIWKWWNNRVFEGEANLNSNPSCVINILVVDIKYTNDDGIFLGTNKTSGTNRVDLPF